MGEGKEPKLIVGKSSDGPAVWLGEGREPVIPGQKPRAKKTPKGKKKSIGGFFGNLASGAEHTVTGLGPGLAKAFVALGHDEAKLLGLAEGPSQLRELGGSIAKSYEQTYSPLLHGDIQEFGNQLYENPLGPILDVAALASGGVAGATKAGVLSKAAREIELAAPSGAKVSKALAGSELSRRLRLAADKTLKQLPSDMQVLGENARYSRVVAYKNLKRKTGLALQAGKYQAAMGKLNQSEVIATNLLHEFPTRRLLEDETARLAKVPGAEQQVRLLSDPKILDLIDNPTPKMQAALGESFDLTRKQQDLLTSGVVKKGGKKGTVPAYTEASALQRRYQPILVTRGAKYEIEPIELEKLVKRIGITGSATGMKPGALVKAADQNNYGRIVSISDERSTVHFVNRAEGTEATVSLPTKSLTPIRTVSTPYGEVPFNLAQRLPQVLTAPRGKTIPGMIDEIRAEVKAEGRHEPIYHPQHMAEETKRLAVGTGGRGVPKNPVHQNKAILQTLGKVAYDIEALTPSYMKTVKWAIYSDRHTDLLNASQKIEKGMLPPEGYIYVKRNLAEDIPYTERMTPEFEGRLDEMFPTEAHQGAEDLLTTSEAEAAVDAQGFRYMVPKAMADKIAGEYVRSSTAASKFIGKPTTVWRSLVLNLRVGWLTNNVVGNTLMYSVRNAGPRGLKAYLQSLDDLTISKLLRSKETRSHLTPDDIVELLPEQAAGTFFGTQLPGTGTSKAARVGRAAAKYTTQPLRRADIAYEQALRRAMTNKLIRESPEFKRVYLAMPKQTRTFRGASRELLQQDTKFAERVSKQVNDAMGDFLQMADFEQTYLRGLMPFYAWYREITRITLKLPLEVPIRTDLLTKLGQIGYDENVAKLGPDGIEKYLRALFIIREPKGGKAVGLNTSGLNPYMTLPQETIAAKALGQLLASGVTNRVAPPNNNQLQIGLGMINPFLGSPIGRAAGTTNTGIAEGIPQTRLIKGLLGQTTGPQRTYENTQLTEILAFLGVPVKNVNLTNARANYYRYHR